MPRRPMGRPSLLTVVMLAIAAGSAFGSDTPDAAPLRFELTYDDAITSGYSGRVYVMMSTSPRGQPRFGPRWFGDDPFFAVDVVDWRPGAPLIVDETAISYPAPMNEVPPGRYRAQAVMRLNLDSPSIGRGAGNAHSGVAALEIDEQGAGGTHSMTIDEVVAAREPTDTDRIKWVELHSDLLSEFHGRDIMMRAAVVLPRGHEPGGDERYPALYWIGGFGGDHRMAPMMTSVWDTAGRPDRVARVVLDPLCFGGHHVFADSANNGPRGRALVEELIPHLEATYPLDPRSRHVGGHSSGGWSSLWLQITYPEVFASVWSSAPDPVDFRAYQLVDIYAPDANVYVDAEGERLPVARQRGNVMAWYDDFAAMERVLGEGGQLRSFEWVFSPRGDDGLPLPIFDRADGAIDAEVAEQWKAYDIRMQLEQRWPTLGPKLAGKLNVICGDQDNFYLEGAVRRLAECLERLGSDASIVILPGRDHSTVMTSEYWRSIDAAIVEQHEQTRAATAVESGS